MSDNRKFLVAKRKNDRGKCTNLTQTIRVNQDLSSKRGIKRPVVSSELPKKNLANDRLKKLRVALQVETLKPVTQPSRLNTTTSPEVIKNVKNCDNMRKRPQCEPHQSSVIVKQSKQSAGDSKYGEPNQSPLIMKEHLTQTSIFSVSPVSSLISRQTEVQISNKDDEPMEWSAMDNAVSSSVRSTRPDSTSGNSYDSDIKYKNKLLIVVDTNIFLSHLQLIKDIVNVKMTGNIKPIIFIPWMVLEELDFIKEDTSKTSLKFRAQEANKYIENILSSKNERMKGQSLDEVNEQMNAGKSPDNKIIACSLQILEKCQNMILLTADVNLKNKAHFNNIPVCSHSEIMAKILNRNQSRAQLIIDKMIELCKTIICKCAKEAYGPACIKMPICQTPLKSLDDCISVFTKYWISVFQENLMKQFKKAIEDLSTFLKRNKNIADGSSEINELLRLCVRICVFFKDIDHCKDSIESTIRDLNDIKES